MICRRCLLRASRSRTLYIQSRPSRQFNAAASVAIESTTLTPTPTTAPSTSTSTSTSTATKPFTTPVSLTPAGKGLESPKHKKEHATIRSTIPAGTPLKGINYLKNKTDPLAMEDSEYPSWLWDVLRPKDKGEEGGEAGDLYSKSKLKRQAAKKAAKLAKLNPEAAIPKVPLYEQSIDMPAGDGTVEGAIEAEKARAQLTKAMRDKRRATIKEVNFLKTMS
ncbi:hypothetical protein EJ08DRAFT_281976 [Tothia fuscella]|uniref:Large ribosomal subunit protein mL54 n=1 Tax=Tothia fuscella TaxID=1048955 RepID=A0A9P4NZY3_9PEZI|nr:hypothetical protein EJ08DRAFT_281976 [Tothia fuscella]